MQLSPREKNQWGQTRLIADNTTESYSYEYSQVGWATWVQRHFFIAFPV